MKKSALISVLLTALLGTAVVTAQDDEADTEGNASDAAVPSADSQEEANDDVFIPSEEVQAAEELAFPVDI